MCRHDYLMAQFTFNSMSEKKAEQLEPAQKNSEIEIVTVGVKSAPAELTPLKEPTINILASPLPPQEQPPGDNDLPPLHTNLGDKEDEQKIREHVQEMMHEIEGQQSDQDEQIEESNVSKSQKSFKSEKKGSGENNNGESNDERKEELPTSRKCFNKLCSSKKIYKKIRSRVEDNKYRFFCKNCYQNYYNNLYCEFCEQIYSNNSENEDDDKWIGCDHCERWNHIECEKKYRDKNINDLKDKNFLYECLVCAQKSKNSNEKNKKQEKEQQEEKQVTKQKFQMNRDQRTLIFHKKYETFPNLEYFLQNYSFRLWINEGQIREDLEHLRSVCLKAPLQDQGKNKFKKVKNE